MTGPTLGLLGAVVLALAACDRPSSPATTDSAPSNAPPVPAPVASASAPAPTSAARDRVDSALAAFRASSGESTEDRAAAYRELRTALDGANEPIDKSGYTNATSTRANAIIDRLDILEGEEHSNVDDGIPEKPEHAPPRYDGAYSLSGTVRKCYEDGVVLSGGGKLYFIKDARCPETTLLHGYVEETGGTVETDLGRDGREAIVANIADKEKAQDDRKAHQAALVEYESEYRKDLQAFQAALGTNRTAIVQAQAKKAARVAERKRLTDELDAILLALARGSSNGGRAAPASSFASRTGAAPSGAAPGNAVDVASLPVEKSAIAAPVRGLPKAATKSAGSSSDRKACLGACIRECSDDSNCERSCVARKCKQPGNP